MTRFRSLFQILALCAVLPAPAAAGAETAHPALAAGLAPAAAGVESAVHAVKAEGYCAPSPWTLCLNGARFSVEVTWTDFLDRSGRAWVAPVQAGDSGLFWFFSDDNWELLVKVLDGCGSNDHFWVFSAATTNLEYRLRVIDHATGIARVYFNPLGHAAPAVTDVTAFPTCAMAPGAPSLLLFANPSTLRVGETSRITAIARDAGGSPAGPGERIRLVADLGTIASEVLTDEQGEAEAVFTAGDQPGRATVTAFLGSSEAEVEVRIDERPDSEILVFASPSVLPVNGTSVITLIARDTQGFPLGAGERIRLVADLGEIEPEVFTDGNGEGEALFLAGGRAGTATVTAVLPGSHPSDIRLDLLDAPAGVVLAASPRVISRLDEGVTIELLASVYNGDGEPFRDHLVFFQSDVGRFADTAVRTDYDGEARTALTITREDILFIPENESFLVTAVVPSQGTFLEASVVILVVGPP